MAVVVLTLSAWALFAVVVNDVHWTVDASQGEAADGSGR
jgi:hypothetical protein